MTQSGTNIASRIKINHYILTAMLGAIILFAIINFYEPQIDAQPNLVEILLSAAQLSVGIFGLAVAKKYRGTKIYGKAYLALGIGFILESIGTTLYTVLLMKTPNSPYPGYPDIFFAPYFFLLLYHLSKSTRFIKRKLNRKDKMILIAIPVCVNLIYIFVMLVPMNVPGSIPDLLSNQITVGGSTFKLIPIVNPTSSDSNQHITSGNTTYDLVHLNLTDTPYPQIPLTNSSVSLIPVIFLHLKISNPNPLNPQSVLPFFAGVFYNTITTLNLSWAILAVGVYRVSMLGNAWGLLLFGIGVLSIADIIYDFSSSVSIYGSNNNLAMPYWVFGCMIVCYALHTHRKTL